MSECKWEVGKTYKTTLAGVTATIADEDQYHVIGERSDRPDRQWRWCWCRDEGYWISQRGNPKYPHLTTELADEPQVEPGNADEPSEADIEAVLSDPVVSDDGSDEPQVSKSAQIRQDAAEALEKVTSDPLRVEIDFTEPVVDVVNHPKHYNQGDIECIDAIQAALSPEEFRGALRFNVLKYVWRCNHKGGLEDVRKATYYLKRLEKEMIRGECVSHGGKGCETEGGEA